MKTKTQTNTSCWKCNITLNFPTLDIPRSIGRKAGISKSFFLFRTLSYITLILALKENSMASLILPLFSYFKPLFLHKFRDEFCVNSSIKVERYCDLNRYCLRCDYYKLYSQFTYKKVFKNWPKVQRYWPVLVPSFFFISKKGFFNLLFALR